MSLCEVLLDRLEEAAAGVLPDELRQHLRGCSVCQEAVARRQAVIEAAHSVASAAAPAALLDRLRAMPRFSASCEDALDLLGDALSGSLPVAARSRFLMHLQACGRCRATWEALATLREVGSVTHASKRLRAAAALPPRQRLAVRRRRGVFDLRLAVAAAYLFAALTVVLAGSPGALTDRGGARIASAATYVRAAVENRVISYSRRLQEHASTAGGWVSDTARETWQQLRELLSGRRENQTGERNV